jgi:hypothetical protein
MRLPNFLHCTKKRQPAPVTGTSGDREATAESLHFSQAVEFA